MKACSHLSIFIAVFPVGVVISFVSPTPKNRGVGATTHFGWFGGRQEKEPVRFIELSSTKSEVTNVDASRVTPNESENGKNSIDVDSSRVESPVPDTDFDVIVVGAGCAGIGTALMLTRDFGLDISRVLLVEQAQDVGESFRQWPEEMKFISPSFNQQGWTDSFDLNAISHDTSPAYSLRSEHPSGLDYAFYLAAIAEQAQLRIQLRTKVTDISEIGAEGGPPVFSVDVLAMDTEEKVTGTADKPQTGKLTTRYIVWAAGEFQFPKGKKAASKKETNNEKEESASMFPGEELCMHNSHVSSWAKLPGDDFVIIGGYESGIDAAVNLARAGKRCKVLASTPCWDVRTGDPSSELAPYTADRLRTITSPGFSPQPKLYSPIRVIAVDKAKGGGFNVAAKWKEVEEEQTARNVETEKTGEEDSILVIQTKHAPVLCTGFEGSVAASASHLFEFPDKNEKKGCLGEGPLLTLDDESTKVPGVFLVGPSVTHGDLSFCFVYKFRQRFAVVANAICNGLGVDTEEAVARCRKTDMYMDDFTECECDDSC